jgi:hypothetical protein
MISFVLTKEVLECPDAGSACGFQHIGAFSFH